MKHHYRYPTVLLMAFVLPASTSFTAVTRCIVSTPRLCALNHPNLFYPVRMSAATTRVSATTTTTTKTGDSVVVAVDPLEGFPRPLILGSASFTRKLILREMGVEYSTLVRPIDEGRVGNRDTDAPSDLVRHVARAKMDHLVSAITTAQCEEDLPEKGREDWVVLTADQVVTCHGKILEKPTNISQAKAFVQQYGLHPCATVGCVVLTHVPSLLTVSGLHTATIHFKNTLTGENAAKLVDDLVKDGAPLLQCAGGLMIEHPFTQQFVDHVDGTEDSVMGLSKDTVLQLLQELRCKLKEAGL